MIRLILCLLELFPFMFVMLPYVKYNLYLKKKDPVGISAKGQKAAAKVLTAVRKTAMAGKEFRVLGLENIPRDQGVLFVSNHRSYFDIITAYSVLPVQTGFIAKDGLKKIPFLYGWMQLLNCLLLDRNDLRQGMEVIKTAAEYTKNGSSVWICPEGTRNKNSDPTALQEFHEASFKIAERSGCPVVPVAIYGTDTLWERQFPKIRPCPVTIEFGTPFRVKDLGPEWKKKTGLYAAERIKALLEKEKKRREEAGSAIG